MKTIRNILLLIALVAGAGLPGYAATVSGTLTTNIGSGAVSAALFVRAGEPVRIQVLGTFVGTVRIERSRDGGASYALVRSVTAPVTQQIAAQTQDFRYRVNMSAYTSGTASYSLDNVVLVSGRNRYSTKVIGDVAYADEGSDLNPPVAGTLYTADLVIPRAMTITGIGILNGATCGTDSRILRLFDSSGLSIGATASTACSGANAFQQIALSAPVTVTAGQYHIGVRQNGVTDNLKMMKANSTIDNVTSATAHSSAIVGSYASTPYAIPVPTTFTAGQGPIAYVY